MSASHSKPQVEPKTVKIVLVGSVGEGKTALLKSLAGEKCTKGDESTSETKCKNIMYSKDIIQQKVDADVTEGDLRCNIWDVPSDHFFQPVRDTHYRDCDIVVFTLDTSKDLTAQESYLAQQNREVPEKAKRIVVVTKSDNTIIEDKKEDKKIGDLVARLGLAAGRTGEKDSDYIYFSAEEDAIETLEKFLLKGVIEHIEKEKLAQERKLWSENLFLSDEDLTQVLRVKKIFTTAMGHLHLTSEVLQNSKTQAAGNGFKANLEALRDQTLKELVTKKRSLADALALAESANTFAGQVANSPTLQPQNIEAFHSATDHLKITSRLGKIIGALIGLAIGVFIGVMAGAALGPGAALTALYGGAKGAMAGATIGGGVFAAAGAWFSLWAMKRPHPATRLEKDAEGIYSLAKK